MIRNLSAKEGKKLLKDQYIGHLSFIAGKWPYSLPITYYYNKAKNTIISYAAEGHKIKAMRKNPNVSLEVNDIDSVNDWSCVLVHGKYEELHGIDAKYYLHEFAEGIKKLIKSKEGKDTQAIAEFSCKIESEKNPVVYRILVDELTAKFRED
ncbi:MAG: pyridoxamine 5'-phosphate oxidase family protein [Flavobacteriaceae bacterium]